MTEEIFLFIIYSAILYYGFIYFKKKVYIKEAVFFIFLMIMNGVISILHIADIDIPTPLDFITLVFKPFGNILYNIFG